MTMMEMEDGSELEQDDQLVHAARNRIADVLGETFASKATAGFCLEFARPARRAMHEALAAPARPSAVVLEFVPRPEVATEINRLVENFRGSKAWENALKVLQSISVEPVTTGIATEVAESGRSDPSILPLRTARLLRHIKVASARDNFLKITGTITDSIERGASRLAGFGLESVNPAYSRAPITEVCWLNRTVRSWANPRVLAELASDESIERFDLPRRLQADLDGSTKTVGAPQFRKKYKRGGKGIIVAVLDSEVALSHPALKGRVVHKQNYTIEPWGIPGDHGTAVAGIVGSSDRIFSGVAPDATIYNYKVLAADKRLNGDDFDGARAIQQALEDGAHIANCSWGAGPAGDGSSREAIACDTAWSLGLVIVKSAGNMGPGASTCTTPADADGVIAVGGTDRAGTMLEDYSSRGPTGTKDRPHLLAPGGGLVSGGITSCLVSGGFGDVGYGTSYAAPHVSGLLALLLERDPTLTPDRLRQKLISSSVLFPELGVNEQGAGLVSL